MRGGGAGRLRGREAAALLAVLAVTSLPLARGGADWAEGAESAKEAARELAQRHWHAQMHRLGMMRLEDRRLSDVLGPIMSHTYTLPQTQVQKALVYTGSNYRLRRLVHELVVGKKPIKVGAIGGSITNGAKASVVGETDWFSLVGKYLRRAFPRAPSITLRNGALPATPSALMNMCLEQYVDDDVDLVFVEYAANDGSNRFDEVKAKVYERLLRKLLLGPSRPAVVLLQLMPKGMAFGPGNRAKVPFHGTLEDIYGAQAQYYDLPWLSFRNAMWRLSEFHHGGYNWTDFMWDVDFMHPIDPGMAAIADMVVHLFQQTALGLLLNPLSRTDKELMQERVPPPMHAGNWQAKNLMCTYGKAFRSVVDEPSSHGWDFVNEGKGTSNKWGFVSNTPGSRLRIVVNSMRDQEPGSRGKAGGEAVGGATRQQQAAGKEGGKEDKEGDKGELTSVMLAYLKSYERMGMASFECTSGCTCEPRLEVDGLHSLRQSTIFLVRLLVSQAQRCEVTVTLLNGTRSGEHKFKVSGIMMNGYTGPDVTEKLHEEQWLGQLQATAGGGGKGAEEKAQEGAAPGSKPGDRRRRLLAAGWQLWRRLTR